MLHITIIRSPNEESVLNIFIKEIFSVKGLAVKY